MFDSGDERPAVPGSEAHRAVLRQLIDAKDKIPEDASSALTAEQEDEVQRIIQEEYSRPWLTAAQVIDILEGLLACRDLAPLDVYERIDDHRSIVLRRVATRCYLAGLEAGGNASTEQ